MRDELNNVSRLGKTLTDIGGVLESVKVTLSLSGESGPMDAKQGLNPVRATKTFLLPPIEALQGRGPSGAGSAINEGIKALKDQPNWTTKSVVYSKTHSGTNPYQWTTDSQLDVDGTFAINQCRPTTPAVDLATSVAELVSEGGKFFRLPGQADNLAGEWLNYNLAISPSIATAKDLRNAMKKQDDIIAQYERDAGRLVRRQYAPDFWNERSSESGVLNTILARSWDPGNLGAVNYVSDYGAMTYATSLHRKRWFSGAFTYPRPPAGWRRTLQELDQVYGIIPGPDTIWELMPYSFVADYFSNLGDVLANASSFAEDGLVMPYGYIMQQKLFAADVMWTGPVRNGTVNKTVQLGAHIEVDVRQRRPATPFGFGFSWGSVTPRQLSIVAALGLSRV